LSKTKYNLIGIEGGGGFYLQATKKGA